MVLVTGELSVTYGGQAPSTLRPGTDAYTPATLPYKATCLSADPCLFIALESPVDALPLDPLPYSSVRLSIRAFPCGALGCKGAFFCRYVLAFFPVPLRLVNTATSQTEVSFESAQVEQFVR